MTPDKTKLIFSKLNGIKSVKPNIKIGFHIHNNSQMAMSNFLSSYDYIDIFDVSWKGMGRGAGNIILEYSILYLIIVKKYNLHIKYLLDFIDRKYNNEQLKDIKNSLLGFLNVHPNRIKYSNDKTLYEYFNYLNNLIDKEKILY
jgi:4-hydroxy 2-oxovalerate aldolase